MPIVYRVDADESLVVIAWIGHVSVADWVEHLREMLSDPTIAGVSRQLVDLRAWLGPFDVDRDTLEEGIALLERAAARPHRVAAVVTDGWVAVGLFEELRDGRLPGDFVTLTSVATACAWLGADAAVAGRVLEALRAA